MGSNKERNLQEVKPKIKVIQEEEIMGGLNLDKESVEQPLKITEIREALAPEKFLETLRYKE